MIRMPGAGQLDPHISLASASSCRNPLKFWSGEHCFLHFCYHVNGFKRQGELNMGVPFLLSTRIFKVSSVYRLLCASYNLESTEWKL